MSDEGLRQLAKRASVTVHGMRATFSNLVPQRRATWPESVTEHCLAHVTGNSVSREATTARTYLDARRDAMGAVGGSRRTG